MSRVFAVSLFLVLAAATSQAAGIIPYADGPINGTQNFGGNLALRFDVNSPITVTDLGVFNAAGTGTITGTIQVAIFNTVSNALVTPIVTFHGNYVSTLIGFDVFQSISPVVLGPGSYEVDAVGFSGNDLNGNINLSSTGPVLNTDGGKLTFTGAAFDGNTTLDDPLTCPGCQALPARRTASSTPARSSLAVFLPFPNPAHWD